MNPRRHNRSGRVALILVIVVAAALGVAYYLFTRPQEVSLSDQAVVSQAVQRADFEAFVTEPGDVSSGSNVEIRCRVRSRGSAGTPILKICDEGTTVEPGEFLLQFDDSVLQQEMLQQQIVVANDKAVLIQAESDLANAKRTLREYTQGLFAQQRDVIDGELFVAEENLERAVAYLKYSERLAIKGYITANQLRADEFAVEKAKKDLAAARRKLKVYDEFTRDRMVGEYEASIKKQEAKVEAAKHTLELSKKRLGETEEQIEYCRVVAPSSGQVVYANDRDRRDGNIVIEEGTQIRENQIIVRLPDLQNMQVDVKINESHVNHLKIGQPAKIILDADPDQELHGTVKEVAPYPYPVRWHGAPLEYGAVVSIDNPPSTIRPGLRAKVKIVYDSQPNVLQVPLAAIIEQGERHYCLLRQSGQWKPRQVQIGPNNNNHVVVLAGLEEGDQVSMTPFQHVDRADLPEGEPSRLGGEEQPIASERISKPAISGSSPASAPAS